MTSSSAKLLRDGPCSLTRAVCLAILVTLLAEPAVVPAGVSGFPFTDETLNYSLKFSTGLSLGKAQMIAKKDSTRGWTFNFTLDASLPAYPIVDRFDAYSGLDLCSLRFERSSDHGRRKARESTWFDRTRALAIRGSKNGGGLSEIPVGLCPHDGLSFLYYLRRELGQGRMPPNDVVLAGAPYRVSMVYVGEKTMVRDNQKVPTDQVHCTIKGPASETHVEILFARDAARTPIELRCPLKVGTFYLELVR